MSSNQIVLEALKKEGVNMTEASLLWAVDWEQTNLTRSAGPRAAPRAPSIGAKDQSRDAIEKALEGSRLVGGGDYDGAIAACTEAIRLDSGILGAYNTRAEVYLRIGRRDKARADYAYAAERRNYPQKATLVHEEENSSWFLLDLIWLVLEGFGED